MGNKIDLFSAYMLLCFGNKLKTKNKEYGYRDINSGRTVSYSEFCNFISKLKNEEEIKIADKYIQLSLF